MITRLQIKNFTSFGADSPEIALEPLNFLVGANASGKTNLLNALKFLRRAVLYGVESAVGRAGGISEIKHRGKSKAPNHVEFALEIQLKRFPDTQKRRASRGARTCTYEVKINLGGAGVPEVAYEDLCVFDGDEKEHSFQITREGQKIVKIQEGSPKGQTIIAPRADRGKLVAGAEFVSEELGEFRNYMKKWKFFDIWPRRARLPTPERINPRLTERGKNLALILKNLETGKAGELYNIIEGMRGAVPGLEHIKPVETTPGVWVYQVREKHLSGLLNPGSLSDGTIRLLVLHVIAYVESSKATLIAIEEPETGVHPWLAESITDMFRYASGRCQVLATTHNPGFLDYLNPAEVLLCEKRNGSTVVQKAGSVETVESFRKSYSLGELWTQGAIGGVR